MERDHVEPTLPRKCLVDHGCALLDFYDFPGSSECVAKAQGWCASGCCSRRWLEHGFPDIRCAGNISGVNTLRAYHYIDVKTRNLRLSRKDWVALLSSKVRKIAASSHVPHGINTC
jgi:hypothetical protein